MDEDFDTYEQYEPGPYTGDDVEGVDLDDPVRTEILDYEDQDADLDDDLEILEEVDEDYYGDDRSGADYPDSFD